jgi:hypothetical protein
LLGVDADHQPSGQDQRHEHDNNDLIASHHCFQRSIGQGDSASGGRYRAMHRRTLRESR